MTILSSLVRLYERMGTEGRAPKRGFSTEKISFSLEIDREGRPLRLADIRSLKDKKPAPVMISVPASVKRTAGIKPNQFWDKTPYVLGVTAVEETDAEGNARTVAGQGERTGREHETFVEHHLELLKQVEDEGLCALRRFLQNWTPEQCETLTGWTTEVLDKNIIFKFDDEYLHDRPAVKPLITSVTSDQDLGVCLVTGETEPVARLHPSIKGVMDANKAGASLVSYNKNAYESLGKEQGDNAPVSEYAAFAYGAALNALLAREPSEGLKQNLLIGNTTVVFWAEAAEAETASWQEQWMSKTLNPPDNDAETNELRATLRDVAQGKSTDPKFDKNTKVYILGLAPNASRLSVRFWYPGSFGDFAQNVSQFWDDLRIEPESWKKQLPAVWSVLKEIQIKASKEPKKTIPPLLGGDIMRSVLSGKPLPRTLLSAVIRRIRADGEINGRRAAICKAVINRTLARHFSHQHSKEEVLSVSLDPDNPNPAYRLGRLFALLEIVQSKALPKLNATIKDRYFAAASATPARIFPLLVKNATHHLASLRKDEQKSGLSHWLEKEIGMIYRKLDMDMPRLLALEDQGRFIVGYYHQRWHKSDKSNKSDQADEANHEAEEPQTTEATK